jgi:hypothetical protein
VTQYGRFGCVFELPTSGRCYLATQLQALTFLHPTSLSQVKEVGPHQSGKLCPIKVENFAFSSLRKAKQRNIYYNNGGLRKKRTEKRQIRERNFGNVPQKT